MFQDTEKPSTEKWRLLICSHCLIQVSQVSGLTVPNKNSLDPDSRYKLRYANLEAQH